MRKVTVYYGYYVKGNPTWSTIDIDIPEEMSEENDHEEIERYGKITAQQKLYGPDLSLVFLDVLHISDEDDEDDLKKFLEERIKKSMEAE